MKDFIHDMAALNLQNRAISLMDNGSWAPTAADKMEAFLDNEMKLIDVLPEQVNIISSLKSNKEQDMDALVEGIFDSMKKRREEIQKSKDQNK